jgi:hypothetical protein
MKPFVLTAMKPNIRARKPRIQTHHMESILLNGCTMQQAKYGLNNGKYLLCNSGQNS